MPEPNPYESPRVKEPRPIHKMAKRTLGMTAVLILAPIAVAIATLVSCGLTDAVIRAMIHEDAFAGYFLLIAWSTFLLPPIVTLVAMLWWARRAYVRKCGGSGIDRQEEHGA